MKLRNSLINIASLNLLKSVYYGLVDIPSDSVCRAAFVESMNKKSQKLGMQNSFWINPSGLGENGVYSRSTARDLALLGAVAYKCAFIRELWAHKVYEMNVKKSYIWHPKKYSIRRIGSTIEMEAFGTIPIVGGKTGAGDGFYTLIAIGRLPFGKEGRERYVSGAIMLADSLEGRFAAMEELFHAIINGGGIVKSARCACAFLVPEDEEDVPFCLYEQNADESSAPMSTTKLLTLMVALDSNPDLDQKILIKPFDIEGTEGTSGTVFKRWEEVTLRDAFYAALLPSSNQAANAIARVVGKKLIKNS